jgi:hypothetical protein
MISGGGEKINSIEVEPALQTGQGVRTHDVIGVS